MRFLQTRWPTLGVGFVMIFIMAALAQLSGKFSYGAAPSGDSVFYLFGLLTAAGVVYLSLLFLIPKMAPNRRGIIVFFLIGLMARLCFVGSTPIYEDDWYRYLWDGAVVDAGVSPYAYSPAQASLIDSFGGEKPLSDDPGLRTIQTIGAGQAHWPERINYPSVTTIYPPVAQAAFAAAHQIAPFNLDAWRFVLLAVDATALAVIFALLKQWRRRPHWALLYWWNPVVIFTSFSAAHMDILLVPFLGGALLLAAKDKPRLSAIALAGAAGVKLWPVILAPILFRRWRGNMFQLFSIAAALIGAAAISVGPMFLGAETAQSGVSAFANNWQRNAFLFPRIAEGFRGWVDDPDLAARIIAAAAPLSFISWQFIRNRIELEALPGAMLAAIVLLYLLAPTGYPWYAIWFFMFLPLAPSLGVAAFAVTLPIYYLRFSLEYVQQGAFFDAVLVPFEFLIPIVLLAVQMLRPRPVTP